MFGKSRQQNVDDVSYEVFTIFDSKAKAYEDPMFAPNHQVLIREIVNIFKGPNAFKNKFFMNAEDFSMFRIGTYSKRTGLVTPQNLEHVVNIHDLKALAVDTGLNAPAASPANLGAMGLRPEDGVTKFGQ